MTTPGRLKISEIIIPPVLARVREIDTSHLYAMKVAYRNGAVLPPPVVDPDGNILVAGRHRLAALEGEHGIDHEIDVEFETFASEADRLAYAFADNLTHGLRPSSDDTEAIVRMLGVTFGWPTSTICSTFRMEEADVRRALANTVSIQVANRQPEPFRLKPAVRAAVTRPRRAVEVNHQGDSVDEIGTPESILLTDQQEMILRRANGTHPSLIIRQIADWGKLPETFWPEGGELLLSHLDDAIDFLLSYREWLKQ